MLKSSIYRGAYMLSFNGPPLCGILAYVLFLMITSMDYLNSRCRDGSEDFRHLRITENKTIVC